MKNNLIILLTIILLSTCWENVNAQLKEAMQLGTLSPTIAVVYSSELEDYQKNHYALSTIAYMGSYMITESIWKSALISLAIGASKEIIYDELMGRGEPLWNDMKWNALGVSQGAVFTISLKF